MPHQFESIKDALRRVPVTISLIVLSVLEFLFFYLGAPVSWFSVLTYDNFTIEQGRIVFYPAEGQYWRLLTPVFLHFGWLHITFNCLWLWELGALVEQRLGALVLLGLVVLCGAGSNIAQHLWSGPSLFGGMSGVVYALLGFCWIYNMLLPDRYLQMPRAIIAFMLVWLVFCMVAPTELLGIGSIANAAHVGGLLMGCALAVPLALYRKHSWGISQ